MARRKPAPLAHRPMPIRFAHLHGRLLISVAFGVMVSLGVMAATPYRIPTQLLLGWDSGVLLYLVLIYSVARRSDIARLRRRAAEEDEGAIALLFISCIAALASLGAIIVELGQSANISPELAVAKIGFGMATIVLSWAFVHTEFALHYAHEYYGEGRDKIIGGLRFPDCPSPDYWDFLYFSLVIAMTSQVSDVAVTSHALRRVVAMHGVLSFFLNLGVLALTINMISNLIR